MFSTLTKICRQTSNSGLLKGRSIATATRSLANSSSNVGKDVAVTYSRQEASATYYLKQQFFDPFQHPSAPVTVGWSYEETFAVEEIEEEPKKETTLQFMNRNARRGKRANHGKRPCSRQARRTKKRAFGNHRR